MSEEAESLILGDLRTYSFYLDLANERRGYILNACINIERMIDEFLAYYFCNKDEPKRHELLGLILVNGRLGFRAKVITFEVITAKLYSSKKDYVKTVLSDIQTSMSARNSVAHRTINEQNFT